MDIKELEEYIELSFDNCLFKEEINKKINEILEFIEKYKLVHDFRLKNHTYIKKFVEELMPLNLFMNYIDNIKCIEPNIYDKKSDGIEYDAIVHFNNGEKIFIEITTSNNGYDEALRMEVLNKQGNVGYHSIIKTNGKSKSSGQRELEEGECIAYSSKETFEKIMQEIYNVVKKKAEKTYSNNHWLLVIYDDQHIPNEILGKDKIDKYLKENCLFKGLNFDKVIFQGQNKGNYTIFDKINGHFKK